MIITILQGAACAYIMFSVLLILNVMSRHTKPRARWSHIVLFVVAAYGAMTSLTNPTVFGAVFALAVAAYFAANRRRPHASQR